MRQKMGLTRDPLNMPSEPEKTRHGLMRGIDEAGCCGRYVEAVAGHPGVGVIQGSGQQRRTACCQRQCVIAATANQSTDPQHGAYNRFW